MTFTSVREQAALDVAFVRLLLPFSSVVVLFVEDFSSIKFISSAVDRWRGLDAVANLDYTVRPRLILVSATEGSRFSKSAVGRLQEHCEKAKLFSTVAISFLASQDPAPYASHKSLKDTAFLQAERTSDARRRRFCLFSALHVSSLYRASVLGAARSPTLQLNWLDVARKYNDNSDYGRNLGNVLSMSRKHCIPEEEVTAFIASTMLLDAYPPRSHCECVTLAAKRDGD